MLIDPPGILEAAEVATLAGFADGIVLVVRAHHTPRPAVREAAEHVRRLGGAVVGVLLIAAEPRTPVPFASRWLGHRGTEAPRSATRSPRGLRGTPERAGGDGARSPEPVK
jgi:hypothetical protein